MTDREPANIAPTDAPTNSSSGYEAKDASVPVLLTAGIGLIVGLVVVQFAIGRFFTHFERERPAATKITPAENLYQQLRDLRGREDTALESYGWVDREAGIVRIPIDRAIGLVAARGSRFGKGPRTEIEMNSHAGTPVPLPAGKDAQAPPPDNPGTKP
jgi:hypothetical protein